MYEYRTETHYGTVLPQTLTPPEPSFRLRDIRQFSVSESDAYSIGREYNGFSGPGVSGSNNIPYTQTVMRSISVQWVVIWERYVPEQENE